MDKQQINVNLPSVDSYRYKDNVKEIQDLVKELNGYTNNLEDKVNSMLKGQETEFVNSYKQHMFKIQDALLEYQKQIGEYQKKIQHYQNQGMLSNLLKKIQFLEDNQRKLLNNLQKKQRVIHVLKGQIGTKERQIVSLHARIKHLLKSAPQQSANNKHEQVTFATQIVTTDKKTLKSSHYSIQYARSPSPQYHTLNNPQQFKDPTNQQLQLKRVNKQLDTLKKKHRQLSSVNSRIIQKASSIEQFFVKVINDLKRKITGRKKFVQCSFEDFKQEDKLELLVKVLSNEEVLHHLYNKIFGKNNRAELERVKFEGKWEGREHQTERQIKQLGRSERVVGRLPEISSKRHD